MPTEVTETAKSTLMVHVNATEAVADSPELLSQIFAYADDEDLATYSRICKTWQSASLGVRWRVVLDPVSLFSVLAPMVARGSNQLYAFLRPIGPSDWERFKKYGQCIRSISLEPSYEGRMLHPSAFVAIASTRVTLNFLPLLTTLHWCDDTNLSFLPIFLHPNVTNLRITFHTINDTTFSNTLFAMSARMPQLTSFSIRVLTGIVESVTDFGELALFELITAYPNLQQLGIPPSHASPRIIDLIRNLERLVHLRIGEYDFAMSDNAPTPPLLIPSNAGAQDNVTLSRLDFIGTCYASPTKYLQFFTKFHSLTSLTAKTLAIEPHETIETMFRLIGERCPSLTQLFVMLDMMEDPRDVIRTAAANPARRITFNTLQPLSTLSHLETLYLGFISPIWITDAEFKRFFSNFGNLRRLSFGCRPDHYLDDPPLTLGAVQTLIDCCPRIREVSLFVDATAPIPPITQTSGPDQYAELLDKEIDSLSLGISNISDPVEVAIALSSIITLTKPQDPCSKHEDNPEGVRRLECWQQVYRDMRIYQQVRSVERERVFAWILNFGGKR